MRVSHLTASPWKQFEKNVRLAGWSIGRRRKDWSVCPLSGDYGLQAVRAGFPKVESDVFTPLLKAKEGVSAPHAP